MSIASLRRAVALSLLGLILAASGAWAAEARASAQPWQASRLADAARGFLGLLWSTLTSTWDKSGPSLDPDGAPGSGNGLAGDSGASLDPNGARAGSAGGPGNGLAADEGATLDPSGR